MRDYASKETFFDKESLWYRKPRPAAKSGQGRRLFRIIFKIIGYGFVLGTLLTLGYFGTQMLGDLPYFAIKEVVLEGGKHINAEELARQAGITPRQNLLFFDLREARHQILQNPWVEEATVRRRFPDTVVMAVKEREPAGLIEVANFSQRFLISTDGVVLEAWAEGTKAELPVITGVSRYQAKVGSVLPYENLAQSFSLISKINTHNPQPLGRVREAHIRPDGSLILTCAQLGAPLYVKAENFPAQWPLFLQFLEERKSKKNAYEYLDLRFSGKVVTKPYQGRVLF